LLRSVLFSVLLAVSVFAQTDRRFTPRSIAGTVHDPSDAAIVGAQVSLLDPAGQQLAQTMTDRSGNFRFDRVAPGAYQVRVDQASFKTTQVSVVIGSSDPGPIRIVLPIAVEQQQVTVQAESGVPVVNTDTSGNQDANAIDRAALDRIPVFDQDYVTTLSRFLNDSAIGTNGVTLVVNGIEANGPGVTPSAVKEVKINQDPYSTLYARPGRARIEITTKGGTPQFHGTANFMLRDSAFDSTPFYATSKPSEHRRFFEGSVTGPLSRNKKTTFLLSAEFDQDDQQAVVFAEDLNGPVNETIPLPMQHYFISGRVFHDLKSGNQIWMGYSFEHETTNNMGVGGTVLPEAGTDVRFLEHEVNVGYTRTISPHWLNQLRFLVGHFDAPVTSLTDAPQIVVSGAVTKGGAQADSRRTEYHFDGADIVSYVGGRHQLKFGIDVPDISRRGADDFTNQAGTYTFDSLAAYQNAQASTYLVQRGQGHVVFLERTVAGFIEDNLRVKPNFSLTFGVRYYFQNYFHDDVNNFAPRAAFAYAPSTNSKTVIRGGSGVFFDRSGPRPIADLLHFDGVHLQRFIVTNPSYPVTPAQLAGLPTSVVVLDPRANIPYTVQYSIGIERQVTAKSTLSASYVGFRGIGSFRSIDANAPTPPDYITRPNPTLGQERMIQSEGYQKSNGLEVTFRGKPSKYFSGQIQYTLSKTYNNTSGVTYFPGNSYDPNADWARADTDRRHKFDLLASSQPLKALTLGMALSLYSGKPVNETTGNDDNHDGVVNDRPPGVLRNSLYGPSFTNLDLNAAHDFVFAKSRKEPMTLTVALNSFNVLNHKNDLTYVGVITSPFFGRGVQAQPARRMQLNLEFKF
jgi:Carboxypeptidase regulatory-like domain